MNKQELIIILENSHIPADAYSLYGGLPNEAYCLNQSIDGWEVYYSERGSKTGLKRFSFEKEACGYLLSLLVKQFS